MSVPYEKAVSEDLNLGFGDVDVSMPAGGFATGQKIGIHTFVPRTFNVLDFGAVGDNETDDTVAIQAAIDYAIANVPATVLFPPRTYKITAGLTLGDASHLTLSGYGATIAPVWTGGTKYVFRANGYSEIADTNPTATINGGFAGRHLNTTNTFVLTDGTGFEAGQYVLLWFRTGTTHSVDDMAYSQITKIKTLVGTTVVTEDAIKVPMITTQSVTHLAITAITLGHNLRIEGLTIDGVGIPSGDNNQAMYISGYRDSEFVDCTCNNMLNGGFFLDYGFRNKYTRLKTYNSGDNVAGGWSALYFWYQTACQFTDIHATKSAFGVTLLYSTDCQFSNIKIEGGFGRGFKIYSNAHCSFANVQSNNNGADGISIWMSYNLQLTNIVCSYNAGSSTLGGFYLTAVYNKRISVNGLVAHGNCPSGVGLTALSLSGGAASPGPDLYLGDDGTDGNAGHVFRNINVGTYYFGEVASLGLPVKLEFMEATGIGTAVAGAVTLHNQRGTITTESLTTAAGAIYTLTVSCNKVLIYEQSRVNVTVDYGGATTGTPIVTRVSVSSQTFAVRILNAHASAAFNGTLIVRYEVV